MAPRTWGPVALALVAMSALSGCFASAAPHPPSAPRAARTPGPALEHRPFACPRRFRWVGADRGSDTLPAGATAARLCVAAEGGVAWAQPPDDLSHQVGRLVRAIDRLPSFRQPGDPCLGPAGTHYLLVLRYPHGTRTVSGSLDEGCTGLSVGSSLRVGTRPLFFRYLRLLDRQRSVAPVPRPARDGPLSCDPAASAASVLAMPEHVVAAIVCRGEGQRARRVARLDVTEVAALRRDLATERARRVSGHGCATTDVPEGSIVGRDAWGATFAVTVTCGILRVLPADSGRYAFVTPLPRTTALLRLALGSRGASTPGP